MSHTERASSSDALGIAASPGRPVPRLTSLSPGAGCACKMPLSRLQLLLASLATDLPESSEDLLLGVQEGDDAAVYRLDDERSLILTADFFTPIVDDPFDWGRIAAANAVSDVYAMGGAPILALNLVAWPAETLPMGWLADVLRGGLDIAREAGFLVVGGHTVNEATPMYGMAVVGEAETDRLMRMDRLRPGDNLVLTKSLGSGVLTTALKRNGADPSWVSAAVASMAGLNAAASRVGKAHGVVAATDVTGFGLVGHLHRMAQTSGVAAELWAERLPLLPGARDAVAEGFVPGGTLANVEHLRSHVRIGDDVPDDLVLLAHDAQTSGGLLLAVPPTCEPDELVAALAVEGVSAAVIGRATLGSAGRIAIR